MSAEREVEMAISESDFDDEEQPRCAPWVWAVSIAGAVACVVGLVIGIACACNTSKDPEKVSFLSASKGKATDRQIFYLFGKPGSGKGTQGPFISKALGIPVLTMSDFLKGPAMAKVKAAGKLAPDDAVWQVLSAELPDPKYANGVILDGFPRSQAQIAQIEGYLSQRAKDGKKDKQFLLELRYENDATLKDRLTARWLHPDDTKKIYNVHSNPPQSLKDARATDPSVKPQKADKHGQGGNMFDDDDGKPLYQRPDDSEEGFQSRVLDPKSGYNGWAPPMLKHFWESGIAHALVDAEKDAKTVTAAIGKILVDGGLVQSEEAWNSAVAAVDAPAATDADTASTVASTATSTVATAVSTVATALAQLLTTDPSETTSTGAATDADQAKAQATGAEEPPTAPTLPVRETYPTEY